MSLIESSIKLDFPDDNFFRFESCDWYIHNQQDFKEMDAGWYDDSNDVLYLIELKDWTFSNLATLPNTDVNSRIWDLVKKSVDSICMLMAVLLSTTHGNQVRACIPFADSISNNTTIKLVNVVHCNNIDGITISAINQKYRIRLSSYVKLFNVSSHFVITRDKAVERFEWIQAP